jgi:hypothetical protein
MLAAYVFVTDSTSTFQDEVADRHERNSYSTYASASEALLPASEALLPASEALLP